MNTPIARRHVRRLQILEKRLRDKESQLQRAHGDRVRGSSRSSEWLDAEAIRAAMLTLDIPTAGIPRESGTDDASSAGGLSA